MTDVLTNAGLMQALYNNFPGGEEYDGKFGYMAVGISTNEPSAESTELGEECNSVTHGSYARVPVTATFEPAYNRVTLEGIFEEDNITNLANITEVGIVDTDTLGSGNFYCIAQVTSMPKTSGIQLKIVLTIGMEQIA